MAAEMPAPSRRVNVLITTNGLGIGGAEVVVRDLVQSIDANRFRASICCLKVLGEIGEELAGNGVDIVALPSGGVHGRVDYLTFLKLRKLICEKQIDVIHTHTTYALADACLCKLSMPRLKVVHTFHFGNYPHLRPSELRMERIFSRVADRLIAVGKVQGDQVTSALWLRSGRVTTVWNGVRFSARSTQSSIRKQFAGPDTVLVGTLANLIEQKGLPDLLRVARRVKDIHEDIRFVIAGEGKLRPELERMRRELGLEETVVLAGWMNNAAATLLPAVDIYFQPSLWEAMSIALLEAMAAGRPVVATRVGEAPYVIADGEDGLLVEPSDVRAMVRSLYRLIREPDLQQRLGEAAARKASEQFTVARMARAYEAVYLDALEQARAE